MLVTGNPDATEQFQTSLPVLKKALSYSGTGRASPGIAAHGGGLVPTLSWEEPLRRYQFAVASGAARPCARSCR
jgi:hypothetical protein